MLLLIDANAIQEFTFRTSSDEHGDQRRYYVARAPYRMIVVCRNDLDLKLLAGKVVDVKLGTETGWREFVREGNADQPHKKATLYRIVPGPAKRTLSEVLMGAPKDEK